MEYTSLIQRYKVNRPLTDEERALQLKQKQRLDIHPHYHLAAIKLNSTFLESVDKYYGWKGALTLVMVVTGGVVTVFYVLFIHLFLVAPLHGSSGSGRELDVPSAIAITFFMWPLIGLTTWLLLKESFRYIHYPIRLNRKNRTLYVFQLNGTILNVPWDEVFFTLGRGNRSFGVQNWDIRGHVLDADHQTVRETFSFSMEWDVQDDLRRHWEYLRRYMEDGPQAIIGDTPVYLPIGDRRETWVFGLRRLIVNMPGAPFAQLTMLPFSFLFSFGRWLAMRTSKIPVWPKHVEDACRIEPSDPFERDARNNPQQFWKAT